MIDIARANVRASHCGKCATWLASWPTRRHVVSRASSSLLLLLLSARVLAS